MKEQLEKIKETALAAIDSAKVQDDIDARLQEIEL